MATVTTRDDDDDDDDGGDDDTPSLSFSFMIHKRREETEWRSSLNAIPMDYFAMRQRCTCTDHVV